MPSELQEPDRRERADRELREHGHDDERPVGVFGRDVRDVARPRVRRQVSGSVIRVVERLPSPAGSPDPGGGRLDRRAPLGDVHNLDGERPLRAGADARGRLAERQTAVAHVALADHAALGVVLRHAVRTIPGAVLTADAGVGAVAHDAGDRDPSCRRQPDNLPGRSARGSGCSPSTDTMRWRAGNHPPSISPTRRQLIDAGLPFCSLQATTQHLQPMHAPMST